jgi:putative NADH-flavin reductase
MRIIIFGASRSVGRLLAEFALGEGHEVTAIARDLSSLNLSHKSLNSVVGDVMNAGFVEECVKGHDMVFCTVGRGMKRGGRNGSATVYSGAASNIAQAMEHQEIRRLMYLSIWGVLGESASGLRGSIQLSLLKRFFPDSFWEHRRALDELKKYDWEWIAVRPAALTNGERTGRYRIALEGLPKGGSQISRADVADFMLRQLNSDEYVHKIPAIAY